MCSFLPLILATSILVQYAASGPVQNMDNCTRMIELTPDVTCQSAAVLCEIRYILLPSVKNIRSFIFKRRSNTFNYEYSVCVIVLNVQSNQVGIESLKN